MAVNEPANEEEVARLARRKQRLEREVEALEWKRNNLLGEAEIQAVLAVILRRMRDRNWLKPADVTEIKHAAAQFEETNYSPRRALLSVLDEQFWDRELKREAPRQASEPSDKA